MEQDALTPTRLNSPEAGSSTAVGSLAMAEPHLILLVEDDFMLRGSLAAVLQSEGYRVESAANALEALERLGGAITAASEGIGRGATFTITLPRPRPSAIDTTGRS